MKLYLRLLKYLKPHLHLMGFALLMTFSYILFNNVSLWVSVDFLRELFENPTQTAVVAEIADSTATVPEAVEVPTESEGGTLTNPMSLLGEQKSDLYTKFNGMVRGLLIQDSRTATLKLVCAVIFFAFLLKNISNYLRRISIYRILLSIVVNLRNNLQERLLRLPLSFYEKWHTGKLTSIVFNDVTQIQVVLSSSFGKLILTPLQIIANMFILLMISWKLTLMAFVIFPVTGYIIYKVGQSIRRKSRRVLQQISVVISYFQESVSSVRVVKAFTAEQREANKFQDANHDFFKKEYRSKKLHYLTSPLNETIGVGVFVLLLWYGGHMVFKGDELTAESFVRFLVFMFTLFQPLRELSGVNNVIQNGMAAAERIFGLMDQVPEIYEPVKAKQLTAFNSAITFNNVRFEYNPEAEVLRNINLDIHKGEMVAFVGHSGAGKTTLVDLIPRFHEISDGRILIDGQNIQEMTLHSLRRQISIVSQETLLFNTSVRQNIGYGIDTFTDEQVIEAAKMANAWEFIEQMEHGLDTIVGEKGINLSGGQRQRLSISRAILKNSPILVLDEATSALDSESEKLVYTAIDNLMKNRTVLAIAHRLSTIIHADKIVVLDKGKIVGMGTHKELLDSNAVYQKLYQMQFNDNQTN